MNFTKVNVSLLELKSVQFKEDGITFTIFKQNVARKCAGRQTSSIQMTRHYIYITVKMPLQMYGFCLNVKIVYPTRAPVVYIVSLVR